MSNDHVLLEQARVRAGWELVDLIGRLTDQEAERLFSDRFQAERVRADETIQPLRPRPGADGPGQSAPQGASLSRFRQILDHVLPGDRVFEVGPGQGYLAGLLLRDGEIASYHGIDVAAGPLRKTQELLEINSLAARAEMSRRDLYELTSADIASLGVDLIVCCEVLEHLPDPERAMKTLAYVLPATAELLITVPLLGRLEHVWGHLAIFDTVRIRRMIEQAGLIPHVVQVIDDRWVLVMASHDSRPSARAARAASATVDIFAGRSPDPAVPTAFRALDLTGSEVRPSAPSSGVHQHLEMTPEGLVCALTSSRTWLSWSRGRGGVRLPVTGPRGLRFELAFDDVAGVSSFHVDAYAGRRRVAQWSWNVRAKRPRRDKQTFVLRAGQQSPQFTTIKIAKLESADAFDVYAIVKPGSTVRFRLTRAAVIV